MSNRELCINIINEIDEERLSDVVILLKNIRDALDESLDDAYCLKLYEEYLDDPDPSKTEDVLLEDFAEQLEIDLTVEECSIIARGIAAYKENPDSYAILSDTL